jgi:hypothetical protein
MVGSNEPAFEVADHPMNPRKELSGSRRVPLNPGTMLVPKLSQAFKFAASIGVNLAPRRDVLLDKRDRCKSPCPGERLHANTPGVISAIFHGHNDWDFIQRPLPAFLDELPADISEIYFDDPLERFSKGIDHCGTQSSTQKQGTPIGTNPQLLLKL